MAWVGETLGKRFHVLPPLSRFPLAGSKEKELLLLCQTRRLEDEKRRKKRRVEGGGAGEERRQEERMTVRGFRRFIHGQGAVMFE